MKTAPSVYTSPIAQHTSQIGYGVLNNPAGPGMEVSGGCEAHSGQHLAAAPPYN